MAGGRRSHLCRNGIDHPHLCLHQEQVRGPRSRSRASSGIFGLDFDNVTGDLLAVNTAERLWRAGMGTRRLRPGWNGISLTGLGLRDTRAVEVIGRQVFVSDGYDSRRSSDPRNHAVFVIGVT